MEKSLTFIPREFPEKGDIVENLEDIDILEGRFLKGHEFYIRGYDHSGIRIQSVDRIESVINEIYERPSLNPNAEFYVPWSTKLKFVKRPNYESF